MCSSKPTITLTLYFVGPEPTAAGVQFIASFTGVARGSDYVSYHDSSSLKDN